MRALSLKQPFAQLIVRGVKTWEARTWKSPHRGRVAIHASSGGVPGWLLDEWAQSPLLAKAFAEQGWVDATDLKALPRSAVVGIVEVTDIVPAGRVLESLSLHDREMVGDVSDDDYLWRLENPIEIEPVPVNGKLNLWTLPANVAEQVERRILSPQRHVPEPASIRESLRRWRIDRAEMSRERRRMAEVVLPAGPLATLVGAAPRSRQEIYEQVGSYIVERQLGNGRGLVRPDKALRRILGSSTGAVTEGELVEALERHLEPVAAGPIATARSK